MAIRRHKILKRSFWFFCAILCPVIRQYSRSLTQRLVGATGRSPLLLVLQTSISRRQVSIRENP